MHPKDIKYIVVHCSATEYDVDIDSRDIDRMHKARGWSGIGYHIVIKINGEIQNGRRLDRKGAHVGSVGKNSVSWGICLVGGIKKGKPENTFSEAQFLSLQVVIKRMKGYAPSAEVLGHRDLYPDLNNDGIIDNRDWMKDCPCFDVKEWTEGLQ